MFQRNNLFSNILGMEQVHGIIYPFLAQIGTFFFLKKNQTDTFVSFANDLAVAST
jgi:hypothetical protein